MPYEVHILSSGYSNDHREGCMYANSTCTLLVGKHNIVVDTLNPWSKDVVIAGLDRHGLSCDDINFLICTHGHSDHVGNNNLFLRAKHIVGYDISFENCFYDHDFKNGVPYVIEDDVKVIPTPGHTHADVTVIAQTHKYGVVAVAGDLFEKEEDLVDPSIWKVSGGSEQPQLQESYRAKIIKLADYIIPGHGPMFKVTEKMKNHMK